MALVALGTLFGTTFPEAAGYVGYYEFWEIVMSVR